MASFTILTHLMKDSLTLSTKYYTTYLLLLNLLGGFSSISPVLTSLLSLLDGFSLFLSSPYFIAEDCGFVLPPLPLTNQAPTGYHRQVQLWYLNKFHFLTCCS